MRMRIHRRILFANMVLSAAWMLYLLSYAPFVRWTAPNDPVTGSFYYRTPVVYRPVEWFTVKTQDWGSPLIAWSRLWGAEAAVSLQAWFYAQQIDDPTDEGQISVNWQ